MTKKLLTLLFTALILNSCKKDSTDFGKFDGYEASPEIGIPLFNRNLTMLNVTESDSANFKTGNDGLISYVFKQDSIYDYGVDNFFNVKSEKSIFEKKIGAISIADFTSSTKSTLIEILGNGSGTTKTTFEALNGSTTVFPAITENISTLNNINQIQDFTNISFSEGWLILSIKNNLPVNLNTLVVDLYNTTPTNILLGTFSYSNIAPGTSKSDSISLQGKTIGNSLGYTMPTFFTNSSAPTAVLINTSDSITLTIQGKNCKVISGTGKIKDQEFVNSSTEVNFETLNSSQKIRKLAFLNGKIMIEANSTIEAPVELTLNFPGATKNLAPFPTQTINIPRLVSGEVYIDSSINLSDVQFDLTTNTQKPYNNILVNYSARVKETGTNVTVDSSNSIKLTIQTVNSKLAYAEGYFGTIEDTTNSEELIDVPLPSQFAEGVSFANAELRVIVKNSVGIPIGFNYNFIGSNTSGKTVDAQLQPFTASFPSINEAGATKTTTQVYSNRNNNGRIDELMSLPPSKINAKGSVKINPVDNPSQNQFIRHDSKINVGIEMEFPLEIGLSNFSLVDSFDFDASSFESFSRVVFGINIDNGFPINADLKMVFYNDSNERIDSITATNALISSIVDANGRTIQSSISKSRLTLDDALLKKLVLLKAKKIKLTTILNTSNSGKKVKFYSDYKMKVSIGIISKFKL